VAAPATSTRAVVLALAGNTLVAVIKFVAFALSGSGAMLSEAIHSSADTGNQVLLLFGLRRGGRARDEDFNYGYGSDRFIFGMLSAAGIFFVGCGVTVYHGVASLLHPRQPDIGPVTFAVLAVSFVIEGAVLLYACAGVYRRSRGIGFFAYVRHRADPAVVAILLEDSAAVLGLALAALGIVLSAETGRPIWDAAASIVVGLLLGLVAVYLVLTNRELLLGPAVPGAIEERFREVLRARPGVASIHDVKSRELTPELYQLKAEIRLDPVVIVPRLQALLPPGQRLPEGEAHARLLREIAAQALQAVSDEIDAIEHAVQAVIPEAKHIDLEVDHTSTTTVRQVS
jgi:zinc transporter 9